MNFKILVCLSLIAAASFATELDLESELRRFLTTTTVAAPTSAFAQTSMNITSVCITSNDTCPTGYACGNVTRKLTSAGANTISSVCVPATTCGLSWNVSVNATPAWTQTWSIVCNASTVATKTSGWAVCNTSNSKTVCGSSQCCVGNTLTGATGILDYCGVKLTAATSSSLFYNVTTPVANALSATWTYGQVCIAAGADVVVPTGGYGMFLKASVAIFASIALMFY